MPTTNNDVLSSLATDELARGIINVCATLVDVHRIHQPDNEFQRGYNTAVAEIEASIRKLQSGKEAA